MYYIVVPHVAVSNCRCNMVEFSETWDWGRAEMKHVLRLYLHVHEYMYIMKNCELLIVITGTHFATILHLCGKVNRKHYYGYPHHYWIWSIKFISKQILCVHNNFWFEKQTFLKIPELSNLWEVLDEQENLYWNTKNDTGIKCTKQCCSLGVWIKLCEQRWLLQYWL